MEEIVRRTTGRFHTTVWLLSATVLAVAVGGCTSDPPQPEPGPEPVLRYEPVTGDLCQRLRVDEIAARHDLTLSPWYEPVPRHTTYDDYSYTNCGFSSQAEDGRFETELGGFGPSGQMSATVYSDLTEVDDDVRMKLHNYLEFHAAEPGVTSAPIAGWWDDGASMERVRVVDAEKLVLDEVDAVYLEIAHFVHHGNLILEVGMHANAPTGDTEEALSVLHSLAEALIEDAVSHLAVADE